MARLGLVSLALVPNETTIAAMREAGALGRQKIGACTENCRM